MHNRISEYKDFFGISSTGITNFNKQVCSNIRTKDEILKVVCPDAVFTDETAVPFQNKEWDLFLANRTSKVGLIYYLCERMKTSNEHLKASEKPLFSTEGEDLKRH